MAAPVPRSFSPRPGASAATALARGEDYCAVRPPARECLRATPKNDRGDACMGRQARQSGMERAIGAFGRCLARCEHLSSNPGAPHPRVRRDSRAGLRAVRASRCSIHAVLDPSTHQTVPVSDCAAARLPHASTTASASASFLEEPILTEGAKEGERKCLWGRAWAPASTEDAAGGWLVERGRTSQGAIVAWLSCCVVMALARACHVSFEKTNSGAAPLPGYRRAPRRRRRKPFGLTSREA